MSDNITKYQKERIIKELELTKYDSVILINKADKYSFIETVYQCSNHELNHYTAMVRNDKLDGEIERIKYNNKNKKINIIEVEDYNRLPSKLIESCNNIRIIKSVMGA